MRADVPKPKVSQLTRVWSAKPKRALLENAALNLGYSPDEMPSKFGRVGVI